jgi:uncharacterized protein (DUF1778 family)
MMKKSQPPKKNTFTRPAQQFRFASEEHRKLVQEAADLAGLSVNAWMVSITLQAARKALAKV